MEFVKYMTKSRGLYVKPNGTFTVKKIEVEPVKLKHSELSLYKSYKNSAEIRGYEFKLSMDAFQRLINSDCLYCGAGPKQKFGKIEYNGIDRMTNTEGYTLDNTVCSCGVCNKMKGTMDREQFERHLTKIYRFIEPEMKACDEGNIDKLSDLLEEKIRNAGFYKVVLKYRDRIS